MTSLVLPTVKPTNGHADYAPPGHPERNVKLAEATIHGVGEIGEAAARNLEEAADAIMREAEEKATKLRKMADAIRQHTQAAAEDVSDFASRCNMVTSALSEAYEQIKLQTGE